MSAKEFFRPTLGKIIVTLIIFILFFFYYRNSIAIACPEMVGYDCSKEIKEAETLVFIVSLISLIPWYILTCVIFYIIKKLRK